MSDAVKLVLIAAVAKNGVIGRAGGLPFRLKSDMKRFKQTTMGKPVVMGRTTWQSMKRALPGRQNIVVSREPGFEAPGAEVYAALDQALDRARLMAAATGADTVFIIGGGEIYGQTIDEADALDITHVALETDGDTRFPPIDRAKWRLVEQTPKPAGPDDEADMVFARYERVKP